MYIWNEMSREEIGALAGKAIVVVPVGATEQHGPHLPVETDNILVNGIAQRSTEKAAAEVPVILGPSVPFGFSHHHFLYPGALSLSIPTFLTVLNELIESIIRSGFDKVFILNGHGGNDEIIRLTAREMALKYPVTVGAVSYWTVAAEQLAAYKEKEGLAESPGHAGQFETSLMLVLKPELVHLDRLSLASPERQPLEMGIHLTKAKIENNDIWRQTDGFTDHPDTASAEIGQTLLDIVTDQVAEQLIDFSKK